MEYRARTTKKIKTRSKGRTPNRFAFMDCVQVWGIFNNFLVKISLILKANFKLKVRKSLSQTERQLNLFLKNIFYFISN